MNPATSSQPAAAATNGGGPSASTAAVVDPMTVENSLYMDAEEAELLHRFATDNPNMVCFKDTDSRIRTLEERFPESELEKLVVKARQLVAKRREEMIRDGTAVQVLPVHPNIPTTVNLREMRTELIEANAPFATHEPFVNIADILAKEVALTEEPRSSVHHAVGQLKAFYEHEVDRLPRRILKYLQRFETLVATKELSEVAMNFRTLFQERLSKLTTQLTFARHALQVISDHAAMSESEAKHGVDSSSRGGDDVGDGSDPRHPHHSSVHQSNSQARLLEELHPLYFRYYLADQAFEYRIRRRTERFMSRAHMIAMTKRYDMYAAAMTHLIGGQPSTGADAPQGVPLLTKQEAMVTDQLDHLCQCFRIPPSESASDLQQFAYNVNRKYHVVFTAQADEWAFENDSRGLALTTSEVAEGGFLGAGGETTAAGGKGRNAGGKKPSTNKGATKPQASASSAQTSSHHGPYVSVPVTPGELRSSTVLRVSEWTSIRVIDPIPQSWESEQEIFVEGISLATEGGRQVLAELLFLKEAQVQLTVDRWKQRTETFFKRLQHRSKGGFLATIAAASSGAGADGGSGGVDGNNATGSSTDMATLTKMINSNPVLQRYLAMQQLRYIRTREFRKKLLDILNYFASVLRMIAQDATQLRTIAHQATGAASIVIQPIKCDATTENEKRLLKPAVGIESPLMFTKLDSYATQMAIVYRDGVPLEVDASHGISATTADSPAAPSSSPSPASGKAAPKDDDSSAGSAATATATAHRDELEIVDGKVVVRRLSDGCAVMDKWALEELERIEQWLAKIGSYFVTKYNDETYPQADDEAAGSPTKNPAIAKGSPLLSSAAMGESAYQAVDYNTVVEDLLESECWFSEGKMKVLQSYREAYEQCTDATQLHDLAVAMTSVIRQRPRIDFSDTYFTASFTREVVNQELYHTLLREMLQALIADERRILVTAAAPHNATAAATVNVNAATANDDKAPKQDKKSGRTGPAAAGGNAPSLNGSNVKPADTAELPGAIQRALQLTPGIDPNGFGLPEASLNDPRLFAPIFPGSNVVNQLDLYRSVSSIAYLPAIVERQCEIIAERFNLGGIVSVAPLLQREVLQELLVQWRLLGEEDRLGRQMLQSSALLDVDPEATANAPFNNIRDIDTVVDSLVVEDEQSARKRRKGGAGGQDSELLSSTAAGPVGEGRALPPLAPRCQYYLTVMDLFQARSGLLTALYETEILYGLHRRQGKVMGIAVKKTQLEPIDFETRRTFAEVDDLEAFKDSSNPLEEILSIKTEMLASLAIGEFDGSMACFDLNTIDGVRALVADGGKDFRRALTVQVCTKNMLLAATRCNMVAVDVYMENVYKQQYDRASKSFHPQTLKYPTPAGSNSPLTPCRLRSWLAVTSLADHSSVDASSGTTTVLERNQLAKYFVSVNAIKSVFRKAILNEMNQRTSDIMTHKKPETLRKVLRDLKHTLVREYCVNITMATYQLHVKYHNCTLALSLRGLVQQYPKLNFFLLGAASDVLRPAPRGGVSGGESRRSATCMITRNGRMDEPRYIPNVLQILAMDYQFKDLTRPAPQSSSTHGAAPQSGSGTSGASAAASNVVLQNLSGGVHSFLRSNMLLSLTCRVLHHWVAIMRLLKAIAVVSPVVIRNSRGVPDESAHTEAALDQWRTELGIINAEIENLRDPNDTVLMVEYLEGKHSMLYLKLCAALSNCRSYVERYVKKPSMRRFRSIQELLNDVTQFQFTTRNRYPQLHYPLVNEHIAAAQLLPADERLRVGPYYAPICSIKKLLDGIPMQSVDFDQNLNEIESMAAGALQLHRDERYFYSEIAGNNLASLNDDIHPPLKPLQWLLLSLTEDEKSLLGSELHKIDQLVDDSRDDAESLIPVTLPRAPLPSHGGKAAHGSRTASVVGGTAVVAHLELMLHVSRRDRLRNLLFSLWIASMRGGWQRLTKAQKAATATGAKTELDLAQGSALLVAGESIANIVAGLDDMYARTILARGRVVCEKEAADRNDNRFRRKSKGNEKEVVKRQHQLIVMEINKLLMAKTRVEIEAALKQLEDAHALKMSLNQETSGAPVSDSGAQVAIVAGKGQNHLVTFKTSVFSDFCRILMAKAMCTRPEGERLATFHIPESSLTLAIDTVGSRLAEWHNDITTANVNVSEQIIRALQRRIVVLEGQLQHVTYLRDVDAKSVERRAATAIADSRYELLFANGVLEKQLVNLKERLSESEVRLRESVRVEYQERISKLESDLILSEQRFQAFKKKTFRDVQASLEEIKRGAMLAVGKMENAPLHMKRQALRIAISDDELNTLKEQNSELKQAILKTKIWYEIKAMREKAAFEKKLKDVTMNIEESRAQFWDNREATEKELKQLKTQLSQVQYQLSQSEIEIEMLRKDLQVQLSNKKDLVSWKLQNAKTVDELQSKLRKYEKWSGYDLDKIIADYEKRTLMQPEGDAAERAGSATRQRGASAAGIGKVAGGASSGAVSLSSEEHKRLLEKIDREKKLKEQAFAKIDELRMAEAGSTEALVWQRKYFEVANEHQRAVKELETTRAFLAANGLVLPLSAGGPSHSAVSASTNPNNSNASGAPPPRLGSSASQQRGNSSAASHGGPAQLSGGSFELRPLSSAATVSIVRPPMSAQPGAAKTTDTPGAAVRHASSASVIPAASRLNPRR